MKYVFDTSVIIDSLRSSIGVRGVVGKFDGTDDELYVSSIVGFELFSGDSAKEPEKLGEILKYLKYFEVVELTWVIARRAGDIYRNGVRGLQIPDYMIAATALELGAEIVTLNRKHFEKVPGVRVFAL